MSRDTIISLAGLAPSKDAAVPPGIPSDFDVVVVQKPIWQRAVYPPRLSVNGLLIGILCVVLAILSGFMAFSLPSPYNALTGETRMIQYTAQLSWLLGMAVLLGPVMGTVAVLLFLAVGLAWMPIFAGGGGWQYVFEPGFGYLLAALPVGSWLARTFHKSLQKTERGSSSLRLLWKAILATLILHALGSLYTLGLTIAGQLPWNELFKWIYHLSLEKAPYDLLAVTFLLGCIRQIRLALWLVLY